MNTHTFADIFKINLDISGYIVASNVKKEPVMGFTGSKAKYKKQICNTPNN